MVDVSESEDHGQGKLSLASGLSWLRVWLVRHSLSTVEASFCGWHAQKRCLRNGQPLLGGQAASDHII